MAHLLVTNCTPHVGEGGVYLLDTGSGSVRRLHDQPVRGMTRGPDAFYLVGNNGAVHRLDPGTWTLSPCAEVQARGCHDLQWHEGEFYLVASYGNRVLRLDPQFRVVDRFEVVPQEGDVCHANCLAYVDGRWLLTIFTLTPGQRQEKRHTPEWRHDGKIIALDWAAKRFEILYEPLSQPHSMRVHDGILYCCESIASRVSAVDLKRRERRTVWDGFGFTRGLEFADGNVYLGVSTFRLAIPLRQRLRGLFRMRCGILELDAKTWRPKRGFPIPGSENYEIVRVDA